ncbi:SMI1/KNR4 family protein [Candidatus Dojkabacteria bacterium]|nr:SMI1/KNR4 family protein [Candidatus Dojkabacteria bacterium]
MISEAIINLLQKVEKQEPANIQVIKDLEDKIDKKLPKDYKDVLLHTNGFVGAVGENGWFELWKAEEVIDKNHGYKFDIELPDILVVGSNQGGFKYGIDLRKQPYRYMMVDPVSMKEDLFDGGASFEELLVKIGEGVLDRIQY